MNIITWCNALCLLTELWWLSGTTPLAEQSWNTGVGRCSIIGEGGGGANLSIKQFRQACLVAPQVTFKIIGGSAPCCPHPHLLLRLIEIAMWLSWQNMECYIARFEKVFHKRKRPVLILHFCRWIETLHFNCWIEMNFAHYSQYYDNKIRNISTETPIWCCKANDYVILQ